MQKYSNIKLLYYFNFLINFILYTPVATIYFTRVTGSYALGMSIFSITMVIASIFQIPTGLFSDIFGRKKTILLGVICNILGTFFFAISSNYTSLAFGAIFLGLARSLYSGNNEALLYETLAKKNSQNEYHNYFGKISFAVQIASAISAVTGSILASISFHLIIWITLIPQIIATYIAVLLVEPRTDIVREPKISLTLYDAIRQLKTNNKLRLLTVTSVLRYSLGEVGFQFRSAFIAMVWPLWAVGIANMLSNICGAISCYFSGKLIAKINPLKILTFEIIFNRIANFIALFYPTPASPVIMSTTSLPFGVSNVAESTLLQKEFTDKQRATLGSINSFIGSFAFAVIAILIGLIADKLGPAKTLIIIQSLLFIPLFFYWKLFHHDKKIVSN